MLVRTDRTESRLKEGGVGSTQGGWRPADHRVGRESGKAPIIDGEENTFCLRASGSPKIPRVLP